MRQELHHTLVPPPLLNQLTPPIKYLPLTPLHMTSKKPVKMANRAPERWGDNRWCLLRLCNVTSVEDLPPIFQMVDPLSKDHTQASIESSFCQTTKRMIYRTPHIYHAVAVMVLGLVFYTDELDDVGDAVNIFCSLDLSPSAGYKAAFMVWRWEAFIRGGSLNSFADTSILTVKNKSPQSPSGRRPPRRCKLGWWYAPSFWGVLISTQPPTIWSSSLKRPVVLECD